MSSYSHLHQHFPTPRAHDRDNGSLPSQSRSSSPTYLSRNDTYVSKSQLQPSTRYFTNQKHISNWPETPQNLQKSTSEICLNVVIELLLVLISLPLLALAIAVVYYKDKKVVDSEWDVFKQIINSVSQSNLNFPSISAAMFHLTSDTSKTKVRTDILPRSEQPFHMSSASLLVAPSNSSLHTASPKEYPSSTSSK